MTELKKNRSRFKHLIESYCGENPYNFDLFVTNLKKDESTNEAFKGIELIYDKFTKILKQEGLIKIETEESGKKQEKWRPKQVFHYIQWKNLEPDFVIDISGFLDKKIESCLAYKTQFYDPTPTEPTRPISSKSFLDSITYRAQDLGRLAGVEHAEGFTTEKTLALKNFDGIIC